MVFAGPGNLPNKFRPARYKLSYYERFVLTLFLVGDPDLVLLLYAQQQRTPWGVAAPAHKLWGMFRRSCDPQEDAFIPTPPTQNAVDPFRSR